MRDITKLNINYIDDNGRYTDYDRRLFMRLTDEEIIEIRRFHHNRLIAKNRVRTKGTTQRVDVYGDETLRKRVRLHNDKKKRRITKRWLKRNAKALIIRGVFGVMIVGGIIGAGKGISDSIKNKEAIVSEVNQDLDEQEIALDNYSDEQQNRDALIKRYCDVFQVDYNIVHEVLSKMTYNFSSSDYYEGKIPGVVCKGVSVQTNNEEELIVCAIRNIKQTPESFNLNKEDLYINNGYTSNNDYFGQIKYYANLFGIDECLVAAIVQSETGFDSQLFNSVNNPAGLRLDGEWWKFANKEEGFIELCLEIVKDYRKIGYPKDEVNDEIIEAIGNIHAPLSDGNIYWVPNVISNYNKYKNNYEEIFGNIENKETREVRSI